MTDVELMAALRKVSRAELATELCERIDRTTPGAETWTVYQIIGTGELLLFIHVGALPIACIRDSYDDYVRSLPTEGAMQ